MRKYGRCWVNMQVLMRRQGDRQCIVPMRVAGSVSTTGWLERWQSGPVAMAGIPGIACAGARCFNMFKGHGLQGKRVFIHPGPADIRGAAQGWQVT